jgi:hypothetical protein
MAAPTDGQTMRPADTGLARRTPSAARRARLAEFTPGWLSDSKPGFSPPGEWANEGFGAWRPSSARCPLAVHAEEGLRAPGGEKCGRASLQRLGARPQAPEPSKAGELIIPEGWPNLVTIVTRLGCRVPVSESGSLRRPPATSPDASRVLRRLRCALPFNAGRPWRLSRIYADKLGTARRWRAVLGGSPSTSTARFSGHRSGT